MPYSCRALRVQGWTCSLRMTTGCREGFSPAFNSSYRWIECQFDYPANCQAPPQHQSTVSDFALDHPSPPPALKLLQSNVFLTCMISSLLLAEVSQEEVICLPSNIGS